jgi:uncharacterized membrane protein YphA (DoxX/SURF4 family)
MRDMNASTAANPLNPSITMPPWKMVASHVAAAFVAILFIGAGIYKAVDPFHWSRLLEELLFPPQYSLPFTLLLSVGEIFGGVLILIPRFRRWGAAITALLLVGFMGYIGIHYYQLIGKDCSCFPWVKRTVGPGFFEGDGAFLLAALLAGWWAKPARGPRKIGRAAAVLAAAMLIAGAGYGFALSQQTGAKAPDSILVDGKPFSLQHGRFFVFFFDPECGHCLDAGRHMSKYHWKSDVTIVGVPTRMAQFGPAYMNEDTHLKGVVSTDLQKLKAAFPLPGDPPYGVAIDNGRQVGAVQHYDDEDNGKEPEATLRQLGLID